MIFGDNSSLEKIGGIAFGKCENIKTLVLTSEKMVAMGNNGFIADGAAVYVPDNLVETYQNEPDLENIRHTRVLAVRRLKDKRR